MALWGLYETFGVKLFFLRLSNAFKQSALLKFHSLLPPFIEKLLGKNLSIKFDNLYAQLRETQ